MVNEPIDIYDENENPKGSVVYNIAHEKGLWHRVVHIWVYNDKEEILLQLRHKDMKYFPNKWDISAAGHLDLNESPIKAALRETKEELGLELKEKDLEFIKKIKLQQPYKNIINNELIYIYFFKSGNPLELYKIQEDEVQDIRFIKITDFEKELKEQPENFPQKIGYYKMIIDEIKKRMEKELP